MPSAWLERLSDIRNRKVADPAFRRWAAGFPPTQLYAQQQAKALFDLAAGFVYSQVLLACVRCDVFEMLSNGPRHHREVATRAGLSQSGAERLLKAAVALDLAEARSEGRYALGPLGAALVDNPGVKAMILHHDILYRDLADPVALLSGEPKAELTQYWPYAGQGSETSEDTEAYAGYTELMAASQSLVTAEILDAYTFGGHRRVLDVGGGDGSFLIELAARRPRLQLTLFDLPPVAEIARKNVANAQLEDRIEVVAGDLFQDDLPSGADVVMLNRVLHDHDDEAALAILQRVRKAIVPGGTVLVVEPMAGTPGAEASGDAYFGFYLLAMGQGGPRTSESIGALLNRAGFEPVTSIATNMPLVARIVSARAATRRPRRPSIKRARPRGYRAVKSN